MSLQERRSREQLHRQQGRVRPALEAARATDVQAAVLRKASNDRAKLQLLESESSLRISTWEGLATEQLLWEAIWAKRQLEVSIWEIRCRKAVSQVYWRRAEGMDRWAHHTLQWKPNKRIVLQHQQGPGLAAVPRGDNQTAGMGGGPVVELGQAGTSRYWSVTLGGRLTHKSSRRGP